MKMYRHSLFFIKNKPVESNFHRLYFFSKSIHIKKDWLAPILRASCRIRTNDPEITNHVLWPTELKRRVGKLSASRRYNQLPLLLSGPGGFEGSMPYRTFPFCGCKGSYYCRKTQILASFFFLTKNSRAHTYITEFLIVSLHAIWQKKEIN